MLTPLSQSWRAHYYDGERAVRHDVTLRLNPEGIEIERANFPTLFWPYQEIVLGRDSVTGGIAHLERRGAVTELLTVWDSRFREAFFQFAPPSTRAQLHDAGSRWELTVLAGLGVLILGALLYFWGSRAAGRVLASLVPLPWEERLGDALAEGLAPPLQRCADGEATQALYKILGRLTASLEDSPYRYEIFLGGPGVNAFAAPGGRIVVTQGLLQLADRPEQLAGVLAHEIQHVEMRHSTQALFREMSGALILASVTGEFSRGSVAVQSAAALANLSHARDDEDAADLQGMRLLQRARIDAHGMVEMFHKFQQMEGFLPSQLQYVSTHPMTVDRVSALTKMAAAAGYVPRDLLSEAEWAEARRPCSPRPVVGAH